MATPGYYTTRCLACGQEGEVLRRDLGRMMRVRCWTCGGAVELSEEARRALAACRARRAARSSNGLSFPTLTTEE